MVSTHRKSVSTRLPVAAGASSATLTYVDRSQIESVGRESARLTASDEAALDAVLADSFPASDPPPWTLGVRRREPGESVVQTAVTTSDSAIDDADISVGRR